MNKLLCKFFGHEWNRQIIGITGDQKPIGKCTRCNIPIVTGDIEITNYMYQSYEFGKHVGGIYKDSIKNGNDINISLSKNEIKEIISITSKDVDICNTND